MIDKLKRLIRWARVSKAGDDDKQFPVQQVEYLGKVGDCFMVFPYGMHGNAKEDSMVLMLSVGGNAENRAGIPGTPQDRPQMADGELCLYHPPSQSIIHFKSNGDIDIDAVKNEQGDVNIKGVNVNITGDAAISGDLSVAGDTALGATVTAGGTNIGQLHTHSGVTSGPSNTGPPV